MTDQTQPSSGDTKPNHSLSRRFVNINGCLHQRKNARPLSIRGHFIPSWIQEYSMNYFLFAHKCSVNAFPSALPLIIFPSRQIPPLARLICVTRPSRMQTYCTRNNITRKTALYPSRDICHKARSNHVRWYVDGAVCSPPTVYHIWAFAERRRGGASAVSAAVDD